MTAYNGLYPYCVSELLAKAQQPLETSNQNIDKIAICKLNGGIGTSMGLSFAKSLLKIKGNNNFLDITCKQIRNLQKEYNISQIEILLKTIDNTETLYKSDEIIYDDFLNSLKYIENET
mgnify:CR=1 FL=1